MTRAAFRQADIERIIRAAKATGAVVQIDLRTLVVTIDPKMDKEPGALLTHLVPDGPEDRIDPNTRHRRYGCENWDE